jgi:hypothetical protein
VTSEFPVKRFELSGTFWLPAAPGRKIPGRLDVGQDGVTLTLYDSLREFVMPENQSVSVGPERLTEALVFGHLPDRNEDVTLREVEGIVIPGPFHQQTDIFEASSALLGGHSTAVVTSRLLVDFDVLRSWAGPSPIASRGADQTVVADVEEAVLHETTYDDRTIRLVARAEGEWGDDIHLERRTFIEVEGNDVPLSEVFSSWIRPIHDLLILCVGRRVSVTEVRVEADVEFGQRKFLTMHTQVIQPEPSAGLSTPRLREDIAPTLLLPDDHRLPFRDFVPAWLTLRDDLRDTVVQLCAPYYASFIYSENRYGSTFQAAEALAKGRFESRELPKVDHKSRVESVLAPARDAGVEQGVLDWAERVLASRNDRPLRDLIGDLLRDSDLLTPEQWEELAPRMASARTGVSHGGANATPTMTRYWLGQILEWVVRGYFVRELGLPADEVKRRIARNPAFRRALREALGGRPEAARPNTHP